MKACAPAPQAASPGLVSEVVLRLTGLFLLTPLPSPTPPWLQLGRVGGSIKAPVYSASTRIVDSHVLQTLGWWAVVPLFRLNSHFSFLQYKPTTNSSCKAALEEPKGQIPSSLLLLLPTGSTEN